MKTPAALQECQSLQMNIDLRTLMLLMHARS